MLSASGIIKDYSQRVLHGIDLEVAAGEFVVIMGPSGSGKTTLLHMLSGMDRPTAGTVTLGGRELTELGERELADVRLRHIGFVFQEPHLLQSLDLRDNIVLPGLLAGERPRSEIVARAEELMDDIGIASIADHLPGQASGGQLQRAGICRALINGASVVFGDEPTGALNQAMSQQILDVLSRLNDAGTTLILVTHDPQVAARASRLVMLVDGRLTDDLKLGSYNAHEHEERMSRVREVMATRGI